VMSGVNPQGVDVHSFKAPSAEDLQHDYLWRCVQRLPARGKIGIFNRSHYEEVLVVRVHPEFLEAEHLPSEGRDRGIWRRRFREINEWEHYLVDNGIHVVKLFLNVSREEQRERFLARIDRPQKNWKFTAADVRERAHWDEYQKVYADVLSNTSTEWAPWHVIPADHKWFERIAAAAVVAHALIEIDPQYPLPTPDVRKELQAARRELLTERSRGKS
jgi:PPK2 family polyphosphate:nucleotide phosphotransferase